LIASETGVGRSEALGTLATARCLESLPATDQALRSGEINLAQASEVARAAEAAPGAEAELLRVASRDSTDVLKQRSRRFVAAGSAQAEAERDEKQRRRRMCRLRDEPDGMVSLYALLLPQEGAELKALHQGERNRVFRSAQRSGRREPANQYSADALMAIVGRSAGPRSAGPRSGPGGVEDSPRAPKAQVHVIVDFDALKRGYREPGERCEIPGVGSISVKSARELLSDSFFRLLVTKGRDVKTVTSSTRAIPSVVRAALEFRDERCQVPSCLDPAPIEIDHVQDYALGNPTEIENLVLLCRWHHRGKTHRGYRLVGEPGHRQWLAPGDAETATRPAETGAAGAAQSGPHGDPGDGQPGDGQPGDGQPGDGQLMFDRP